MKFSRRAWLLLAVLPALTLAAVTGTTSYHWTRTPSNKLDSRYQDGNDGTPATPLTWATITPIAVLTTDTDSVNLCQAYLTQPAAPNDDAVISVTSGYSLPTGFSLGSTNNCVLSWATPSAAVSSVSVTATLAGVVPAVSLPFAITITAPPSGDTTAPTIATGLVASDGVGSTTVTWDAAGDVYEADGDTCNGTISYTVTHSVAGSQNVAGQPSLCKQFSKVDIGTGMTTTATQSGADWTITADKGDVDGTDDQVPFLQASVTGLAKATVKVTALTYTANFAKAGIMARESNAATNSRYFQCHVVYLSDVLAVASRYRTTDGGTAAGTTVALNGVSLPVWVQQEETSAGVFDCRYSTNGNTFITIEAGRAVAMSTTKPWGLFASPTNAAANVSATLAQFNLNNQPRVSATVTTSSAGTITVTSKDGVPNSAAASVSVASNPTGGADTTAPTRTAQPANPGASATTSTSITWGLGTCSDASGIRGYIPYTKTSAGGTRTTQTEQSVNSYTQSGLSANTTYYLDTKCVDNAGNVEASFSNEVSATTQAAGGDPASAPTITSFDQNSDRSASYTLVHSTVANADHYDVEVADCVNGVTAGSYSTVGAYRHTTATTNLTGFAIGDAKSIKVKAANLADTVVFASTPTGCKFIREPYSVAQKWNPGHYIECVGIDDTPSNRTTCWNHLDLTGVTGVQKMILLGWMEDTAHGNPTTGVGYEKGKNFFDEAVAAATTRGKQVAFWFEDKMYGGWSSTTLDPGGGYVAPKYMLQNPSTYLTKGYQACVPPSGQTQCSGGLGIEMTIWDPDVEQAIKDFFTWFCLNYDGSPRIESIGWSGFSVIPAQMPGFDVNGYQAIVKRILQHARQQCTQTQITMRLDWPGYYVNALDLAKWAYAWNISVSDYDTGNWTTRNPSTINTATANKINYGRAAYIGYASDGAGGINLAVSSIGTGGVDLRDKIPYWQVVESPDWTISRFQWRSINENLDIAASTHASYIVWSPASWVTTESGFSPAATNVWNGIVRPCLAASTDQAAISCTISIRNSAIRQTYPSGFH